MEFHALSLIGCLPALDHEFLRFSEVLPPLPNDSCVPLDCSGGMILAICYELAEATVRVIIKKLDIDNGTGVLVADKFWDIGRCEGTSAHLDALCVSCEMLWDLFHLYSLLE